MASKNSFPTSSQISSTTQSKEQEQQIRKELERRYMALKMIEQHIKTAQNQFVLLEQQLQELDNTKEALDDIALVKPGTDILVPLANGVFAHATLANSTELLVNVGANASVAKEIPDVKKLIDEQAVEVRKAQEEVSVQLQELASQAQVLEQEMTGLLS